MADNSKAQGKPEKKGKIISRRPLTRQELYDQSLEFMSFPASCRDVQIIHAWDPRDCSPNIFVKDDDPFTFHRKPMANSTDSIRGKYGYICGIHRWELYWVNEPTSSSLAWNNSAVGVATVIAPLHFDGDLETRLSKEMWVWNLNSLILRHDGMKQPYMKYPTEPLAGGMSSLARRLEMVLDMDTGTLSFIMEGEHLGVAFCRLKGKTLYPIFLTEVDNCEVTMKYLRGGNRSWVGVGQQCETSDDTFLQQKDKIQSFLKMPPPSEEALPRHAWSPDNSSPLIGVKDDDPFTFRHDGQDRSFIRGKVGYRRGFHMWKILWPNEFRGTHAVVGVATKNALLHQCFVGSDRESWGLELSRSVLFHDSRDQTQDVSYPKELAQRCLSRQDTIFMVLDMDEGTLSFLMDAIYLGVAFRGLKGKKLYPIASTAHPGCEVSVRYMGGRDLQPLSVYDEMRLFS